MTIYTPIEQRDEEGQPIRYPQRRVVDSGARVPGGPTRKQAAVRPPIEPEEDTQYIKSSQLPRVMNGSVGGVPVKIVNLIEMFKLIGQALVAIALVVFATLMVQNMVNASRANMYSYDQYRLAIHATNTPCRLDGSARATNQNGTYVVCAESGNKPTKDQLNQWQGYMEWQACYQYGDQMMCNQLND